MARSGKRLRITSRVIVHTHGPCKDRRSHWRRSTAASSYLSPAGIRCTRLLVDAAQAGRVHPQGERIHRRGEASGAGVAIQEVIPCPLHRIDGELADELRAHAAAFFLLGPEFFGPDVVRLSPSASGCGGPFSTATRCAVP